MQGSSRRDQKTNAKFTARMNRTLQQQENQHGICSSARHSSFKRQGGVERAIVTESGVEARMIPPPLSPAPHSCAEVLTSNHKTASPTLMLGGAGGKSAAVNRTVGDSTGGVKDNFSGAQYKPTSRNLQRDRTPLQNVESTLGELAGQKRPNKTPQPILEQAHQLNYLVAAVVPEIEGDFRATPTSLFGKKANVGH